MQESPAGQWKRLLKWKAHPPPSRERPWVNQHAEEAEAKAEAEERRASRRLSKILKQ